MESRFNFYDFLGYIIPGYLLTGGLVLVLVPLPRVREILDSLEPYKYIVSFATVLVAYGAGHLTSQLAGLIAERLLIGKWLGYPSAHLFGAGGPGRLFAAYRRAYSEPFVKEWKPLYEETFGMPFEHHQAFLNAYHYVKENSQPSLARLNTFIAIYDFARNTALALFVVGIAAALQGVRLGASTHLAIASASATMAVLLFLRYLKFFRHYADEVFRTFYVLRRSRR